MKRLSRHKLFSVKRQQRDVSRHYDLGNDFYRLWLDRGMNYSCAYFKSPDESLETAQNRKLRHTLDKLNLAPNETLLDIGCGWGALLIEAETNYGVILTGITLSIEQRRFFEERMERENPRSRAKILLKHYHSLAKEGAPFDKIVSIGMTEHVGHQFLPLFFQDLKALLKPGGLGLLHCITGIDEGETNPWILKYIFPGGYIPTLREIVRRLSMQGMTIWDVENIGPHYALTFDRWAENFERHADRILQRYGEEFVRMWRFYLRPCASSFRRGNLFVHQTLFSNGPPDRMPLSREFHSHDLHIEEPSILRDSVLSAR